MSKQSHHLDAVGHERVAEGAAGPGDVTLAVSRQEQQRSEIQAKLNRMLDSLRSSVAMPQAEATPVSVPLPRVEPVAAVRARALELFAEDTPAVPVPAPRRPASFEGPAASLKAGLDNLVALESAIAVRAELRRDTFAPLPFPVPTAGAAPLDLLVASEIVPPAPLAASIAEPETAPAWQPQIDGIAERLRGIEAASVPAGSTPAWQTQIDDLNARLQKMEAASVLAATTLDSLVASFDAGQQNTFAAAQACAREEVRSAIATEVHPALIELSGASSHAHEEIHGVLTLLGTCLERVVGHLQKIEGLATAPVPGEARKPAIILDTPALAMEPPPCCVDEPTEAPSLPASAPSVPLPGFGRRSKLAALIDFGFGTRAA